MVAPGAEFLETEATTASLLGAPRRLWTRAEFRRALQVGLFRPDERLELLGGEVVRKVSPQESPHATGIRLAEEALRRAFPRGHDVRSQLPLTLGEYSEPEPDIAVVVGEIRDYEREHPSSAVLVLEVADTSLRTDRGTKAGLYAAAGVPEYWIVNLVDRAVEVHRDPIPMADRPFGSCYRTVESYGEGAQLTPLAAPSEQIAVSDLLPRPRPTP